MLRRDRSIVETNRLVNSGGLFVNNHLSIGEFVALEQTKFADWSNPFWLSSFRQVGFFYSDWRSSWAKKQAKLKKRTAVSNKLKKEPLLCQKRNGRFGCFVINKTCDMLFFCKFNHISDLGLGLRWGRFEKMKFNMSYGEITKTFTKFLFCAELENCWSPHFEFLCIWFCYARK